LAPLLLSPAAKADTTVAVDSLRDANSFAFAPLGLKDLQVAQASPEPGTDNVPVTVTEGESKAKEE